MASIPRLFFAAIPASEESAAWHARLDGAGVTTRLGRSLFPSRNWHQTLSDRHFNPDARTLQCLLDAGDAITADSVALQFNRVTWSKSDKGIHCTLRAHGRPASFDALLASVQRALATTGLADGESHSPHITLSYSTNALHPTVAIVPIDWRIHDVVLLKGHGDPYRYDVLGRWPLKPSANSMIQADFFASA